jgi:hypothetical protein
MSKRRALIRRLYSLDGALKDFKIGSGMVDLGCDGMLCSLNPA